MNHTEQKKKYDDIMLELRRVVFGKKNKERQHEIEKEMEELKKSIMENLK